jgi:acrylyl-CoA reductase (NADPH)
MFKALMLDRRDGTVEAAIRELDESALPEGDTLIDVEYSSLNYKDGLAITGKGKIIRGELPFIPGIDLAGRIIETSSGRYASRERVVVTGWQIGEKYWGGYSQKQRVRSEWLVPIPESLSTRQAMILGTAGVTAMLSVMALEHQGLKPDDGEVVVTGASGGVGSIAIALLSARGYQVVASTGSQEAREFLESLGAQRIIDRHELPAAAEKPLDTSRWAGAIDTVGGATLAGIISQLFPHASVAACGNASGFDLETTVFPFILRGVNLLGIDSNTATFEQRRKAWSRMASDLSEPTLERIQSAVIGLEQIAEKSREITEGKIQGRVVIDVMRS